MRPIVLFVFVVAVAVAVFGCSSMPGPGPVGRILVLHDQYESESLAAISLSGGPTRYAVTKAKRQHLEAHPECAMCGIKGNISNGNRNDVHHIIPESVKYLIAADKTNLITLCRFEHFSLGHLGNWRNHNPHISEAADDVHHLKQYWKDKGTGL